MCTLTWNVSGEDLWVCFNRDESRTRARADYPGIHTDGSHPVAYARDPDGGGTWLAVSKAGFVVALMNNYEADNQPEATCLSRGRLVTLLAGEDSLTAAAARLQENRQCTDYPPFFLFLLSIDEQRMWTWDQHSLKSWQSCPRFWTTSSYNTAAIGEWRRRQWEKRNAGRPISLKEAIAVLRERSEDPACGMTMDRTDARTVSQSAIRLNAKGMEFRYFERQMNGDAYEEPVTCHW